MAYVLRKEAAVLCAGGDSRRMAAGKIFSRPEYERENESEKEAKKENESEKEADREAEQEGEAASGGADALRRQAPLLAGWAGAVCRTARRLRKNIF